MNVPRETREKLEAYVALLKRWNRALNLVSDADLLGDLSGRHIAQSLALIPYFPAGMDRFIDMGSGGGFPAIPIAIVSGCPVDMIESDQRKAAFLETALAALGLQGKVWPERIERAQVPPAQCVTARALAALPQLLGYTYRILQPGGVALFLKGDRADAEVDAARHHWSMHAELIDTEPKGSRILKISRLEPADDPSR